MVFYKMNRTESDKKGKMISIHYLCYIYLGAHAFGCYLFSVN